MEIRMAEERDLSILCCHDRHIAPDELRESIRRNRVYVAEQDGTFIGWARYNLFWDNTPFLNMLYLLPEYRGKGCGRQLLAHWEAQMKQLHYSDVLTSTASDEYAQHFYMHLGYHTIGGFLLPDAPYEIILQKRF